jgi:hypothetical protein
MLSHLQPTEALSLMRECCRVLKRGGVLRVVTEDLEQMCRAYLQTLEAACRGDRQSASDHEWMLLELYDQATREYPGGRMSRYLRQDPLPNEAFIYSRFGEQGRRMVSGARAGSRTSHSTARTAIREFLAGTRAKARKLVLTAVLGSRGVQAFETGSFRLYSGQVTHRMYDRYSLQQLFLSAGLSNVSLRSADESAYAFWGDVNLDISPDGQPVRPHALIMEGIRAS